MSESKAKGPNDLTLKDVAVYLTAIVVTIGAGALGIAPMPLMSGLAAGSIVAIHFFKQARRHPPNDKSEPGN
jgi:hypothetical protein